MEIYYVPAGNGVHVIMYNWLSERSEAKPLSVHVN